MITHLERQTVVHKFEGKKNMLLGLTKEKLGELTGNKTLKREGQFQKVKGATQDAAENAKTTLKKAVQTVEKQATRLTQKIKPR